MDTTFLEKMNSRNSLQAYTHTQRLIEPLFCQHFGKFFYKIGFTLAEILIVLGIIGVVADMTIPTLVVGSQKQETVTKLQKFYSTLSQVVKLSEIDNDYVDYWDFSLSSDDFYKTYLKPYLKVSQEYYDTAAPQGIMYKVLNGKNANGYTIMEAGNPKIILNDGTLIAVRAEPQNTLVYIDVNGFKKPNRIGRDLFMFLIQKDGRVTPYGQYTGHKDPVISVFGNNLEREKIIDSSKTFACSAKSDGPWCAALIMADGWKIAEDYPW